jgi:hypothetical protein
MKVCFNQPCFIPWGGFFCRLLASDTMILLDDTLFAQGFTFVNRNRLKGHDGEIWVTVPLKKVKGQRQRIRELRIHEPDYWGRKWKRTLYHAYKQSQYYDDINSELARLIGECGDRFIELVVQIIDLMKSRFDIETSVRLQSDTGANSGGIQLIMDLAEKSNADEVILPYYSQGILPWKKIEKMGIKVTFLHYLSPVYPQFWGFFLKNLSTLDLLFCLGPQGRTILESGYKLVNF